MDSQGLLEEEIEICPAGVAVEILALTVALTTAAAAAVSVAVAVVIQGLPAITLAPPAALGIPLKWKE